MVIQLIIITLSSYVFLSIIYYTVQNGISPTPTSYKVRKKLLYILKAYKPKGNIYELGSGWGSLVFPLLKLFPTNKIYGLENSPFPFLFMKLRSLLIPSKQLVLLREDFYQHSLVNADFIICYLYPNAMEKLKYKFKNECSTNTLIVSHTFAIPGWKPIRTEAVNDIYQTKIYIYKM